MVVVTDCGGGVNSGDVNVEVEVVVLAVLLILAVI